MTAAPMLYRLARFDLGVEACRNLLDEALAAACLAVAAAGRRGAALGSDDAVAQGLGLVIVALELRDELELGWPPMAWHLRGALYSAMQGRGYAMACPSGFGAADVRAFAERLGLSAEVSARYVAALAQLEAQIDERRGPP